MSGLLINGKLVGVPGVTVIGPHETAWAHLSAGDCRPRSRLAPTQIVLHRTVGDVQDKVMPGIGPAGGAQRTAEYWAEDTAHSGAHIVVGSDGVVACLADLVAVETYHATVSNSRSIGIEMHEQPGGVLYQAQLDATVSVVIATARACGIQLQFPSSYTGHPLERMLDGGHDVVGVLGHRDNTEQRGRWDPGDVVFALLHQRGATAMDFARREDIAFWAQVQIDLNRYGNQLAVDGVPGALTTAALRRQGYVDGILALGKATIA